MNREQIQYIHGILLGKLGRLASFVEIPLGLALALELGYVLETYGFAKIPQLLFPSGLSVFAMYQGLIGVDQSVRLWIDKKKTVDQSDYPLEHVDKVLIEDDEGLELILEKTAQCKQREWGTALNVQYDHGENTARITRILPCEEALEKEFFERERRRSIKPNFPAMQNKGFNGLHHYHTGQLGAFNFYVNIIDRQLNPANWISTISFNTSNGPEIVAYNKRYTYVPTDATNKRFVLMSNREVIESLRDS